MVDNQQHCPHSKELFCVPQRGLVFHIRSQPACEAKTMQPPHWDEGRMLHAQSPKTMTFWCPQAWKMDFECGACHRYPLFIIQLGLTGRACRSLIAKVKVKAGSNTLKFGYPKYWYLFDAMCLKWYNLSWLLILKVTKQKNRSTIRFSTKGCTDNHQPVAFTALSQAMNQPCD